MAPAEPCPVLPISEISAYSQRWTIRARVTSKSALRTFSKGDNAGKVFHVHLLDAQGGEIRASFFNEAADKHFDMLQLGKCFALSRGNVKIANRQYNPCDHRYELNFDKGALIEEVDDDRQIEEVKLSPVDLRSVQTRQLPCKVDLCGVIVDAGKVLAFTSKEGKDLVKRDVTIADDTATSITVTIWGDRAKQEDAAFESHPVVCFKGVALKEWNGGRSGSLSEGGAVVLSPKLAESERVQQWWSAGGREEKLTALSKTTGSGSGGRAANAPAVGLPAVRRLAEKALEQSELCSSVCRLALVQLQKRGEVQPVMYTACQELKEGKEGRPLTCNRRVDSSGFCASCNRVGKSAPRFNLRCRFADFADNVWLTTFHEAAEQIVGMRAEQAKSLEDSEGGREALDAAIAASYFRAPVRLTLRAKLDTYNGEARTNVTCIDARPVPRGEHGRAMLKEIQALVADDAGEVA